MYKLIIYDFDNTIFDSIGLHLAAQKEWIKKYNLDLAPTIETFKQLINNELKISENLMNAYWEIEKNLDIQPFYYKDFFETLDILTNTKAKLGIVSGSTHARIKNKLPNDFDKFDLVIGSEDYTISKPDPQPLLKICSELKISPSEAIYIGDFVDDSESADAAGIDFILYFPEFHKNYYLPEVLKAIKGCKRKAEINNHVQILGYLINSNFIESKEGNIADATSKSSS